jgi:hypothetical protein
VENSLAKGEREKMNREMTKEYRTLLLYALLCILTTACNSEPPATVVPTSTSIFIPSSTPGPTDRSTSTNAPLPANIPYMVTDTPFPTVVFAIDEPLAHVSEMVEFELSDRGWIILESKELGIVFEFPPLPGATVYEYNYAVWPKRDWDPTGTLAEWMVKGTDGYRAGFAGCASSDLILGREAGPTTIMDWYWDEQAQQYYISWAVGKGSLVEPLEVVTRSDGLQGLIYECGDVFIYGEGDRMTGRCAVLRLPEDQEMVDNMGFHFPDEIKLSDIESVLQSVTFK